MSLRRRDVFGEVDLGSNLGMRVVQCCARTPPASPWDDWDFSLPEDAEHKLAKRKEKLRTLFRQALEVARMKF